MSLVEILATLGILTTLISLILPGLGFGERVDRAKCLSNMKSLGTAFRLYAEDNNQVGPPDARDRGNVGLGKWELGDQKIIFGCLAPYLASDKGRSKVVLCPGTPKTRRASLEDEHAVETSYWMTHEVTSNSTKTTKLFMLPQRRVAIMDTCYWWNNDIRNNHRGAGFNAFRLDGSVSWISKKQAQGAVEWRWADFDDLY